MKPIRVLHVFGNLDTGGAESRTMDIYRQIDRSKVQFDFLIHTEKKGDFEDEINDLGGKVYRVPSFNAKNFFAYFKQVNNFFKLKSKHRIVHGHMLTTGFIYHRLAKKNGVNIRIVHARAGTRGSFSIINIVKELLEKLSRFQATHMFAVSKIAGYSKFGKKNVETGKVKVVPNAIKTKKYAYNALKRKEKRIELGVEGNVIGHIGRFQPQKNHFFLLNIFNEFLKLDPRSMLILIGKGDLEKEIIDKAIQLGIEEKVIILGSRNDVPDILQAMDILVFPSTHEGFPGVVLESQAAGLPCLISNEITNEVNVTNLVKYISLKENTKTWAENINYLLANSERKESHKNIIKAGYDIEAVSKWYEEFYLKSNS